MAFLAILAKLVIYVKYNNLAILGYFKILRGYFYKLCGYFYILCGYFYKLYGYFWITFSKLAILATFRWILRVRNHIEPRRCAKTAKIPTRGQLLRHERSKGWRLPRDLLFQSWRSSDLETLSQGFRFLCHGWWFWCGSHANAGWNRFISLHCCQG